jgi:hypothetical protein
LIILDSKDAASLWTGYLTANGAAEKISTMAFPNDWTVHLIGNLWYVIPYGVRIVEL